MKTKSQLSSFCMALVILSSTVILHGCTVVFTNPPPGSQHTRADTKLMGRWSGQDEQGNRGFIQFDGSNKEMNVSIFGEKSDLGYRNPVFTMITTRIGN